MKKEPNITEHQAREIVEKMGRREPYTSKSIDDFYRSIGLEPEEPEQLGKTVTEEAEIPMADEPSGVATEEAAMPQKRVSSKQRRLSLDEYRTTYLKVPKIINRKPVFVSETVRDELDRVVRYLGGKGMSASGLIENLVRHCSMPTGMTSSNGANSDGITVEQVEPLDALHRFDRYTK